MYIHNPYEVPNYDAESCMIALGRKSKKPSPEQEKGITNIENDRLIQTKLSPLQRAYTIESKVYVLHIGSKSYKDLKLVSEKEQRKQIKDNLEAILSQTKNTDIMILLENSAANKCHGAQIEDFLKIKRSIDKTLSTKVVKYESPNQPLKEHKIKRVKLYFDTQYYFAAGSRRYPDDYKQVMDKKIKQKDGSVKKIKATIFGFEQDVYAPLLQGQLSQEILKMLATHPKMKAMILKTLGKTEEQKQEQIFQCLYLEGQERYQDSRKQETIERMRRKQIEQMLFKTNEALLKHQKLPFATSSKNPPLIPKTFGGYVNQLSFNIKKLKKLQEQEEDKNVAKMLTNLVDHIATMNSNFQKYKEISDQEAKTYLDNMKDIEALPKRLKEKKLHETYQEKLFEITQWYDKQNEETQRIYTRDLDETTQAKLTAIGNTSLNDKERKRANERWQENAKIEISTNQKKRVHMPTHVAIQEQATMIEPPVLPLSIESAYDPQTGNSSSSSSSTKSAEQSISKANIGTTPPMKPRGKPTKNKQVAMKNEGPNYCLNCNEYKTSPNHNCKVTAKGFDWFSDAERESPKPRISKNCCNNCRYEKEPNHDCKNHLFNPSQKRRFTEDKRSSAAKSTNHIRKEDCIEIKLLKQQQVKDCKCNPTKIQLKIQEYFAENKRKYNNRNTYYCCKCLKICGYTELYLLSKVSLYIQHKTNIKYFDNILVCKNCHLSYYEQQFSVDYNYKEATAFFDKQEKLTECRFCCKPVITQKAYYLPQTSYFFCNDEELIAHMVATELARNPNYDRLIRIRHRTRRPPRYSGYIINKSMIKRLVQAYQVSQDIEPTNRTMYYKDYINAHLIALYVDDI
ncbi:24486_t:CDS:10 [Racocetra persica]|uniref:24486_t:CDS:1 n=1 Tax=Racocetra persica TaxID=160502 RepID=A0ACA9KFB3_9GLOM|nr:24486_t:CDS:10 [Racocetra persica]